MTNSPNPLRTLLLPLILLGVVAGNAHAWRINERADAMSDDKVRIAHVMSADGYGFGVMRRSDGAVWGYLIVGSGRPMGTEARVTLRIDKQPPVDLDDTLQQLSKDSDNPMATFEWNPTMLGFRLWHGDPAKGCGMVERLYRGNRLVVRYYPSESTVQDVRFDVSKARANLPAALGVRMADCNQAPDMVPAATAEATADTAK